MSRPSDGMELDELRDEFDWMYEFQSLMAERIRGDADVHNLVDYVGKLEEENARLRDLVHKVERFERIGCHECPHAGCGADTLYDDDCPMRREIEQDKRELGVDA